MTRITHSSPYGNPNPVKSSRPGKGRISGETEGTIKIFRRISGSCPFCFENKNLPVEQSIPCYEIFSNSGFSDPSTRTGGALPEKDGILSKFSEDTKEVCPAGPFAPAGRTIDSFRSISVLCLGSLVKNRLHVKQSNSSGVAGMQDVEEGLEKAIGKPTCKTDRLSETADPVDLIYDAVIGKRKTHPAEEESSFRTRLR